MRHKKKFNHLGRKRGHRHAMLANMASSLIVHKRIKTTTAKAKALKSYVEPLITKAKEDTTHSRRQVFSYLQDKEATAELFREVAGKVGDRPGGYTRIIKLGKRLGDAAEMCIIELVDYNENILSEKAASKSSRRRRGAKKKTEGEATTVDTAVAEEVVEEVADAPVEDAVEEAVEVEKETPVAEEAPAAEAEVVEEVAEEAAPEAKEEPAAEAKEEETPEAKSSDSDDSKADEEEKKEE